MKTLQYIVLILSTVLLTWLLFRSCDHSNSLELHGIKTRDSLLAINKDLQTERDLLELQAATVDTARIRTIVKYRTLKSNPDTLPCDTVLKYIMVACDSIIVVDSTEISLLKRSNMKADTIIGNLEKVVQIDSLTISGLKKQVRNQRRLKLVAISVATLLGGLAVVR